VIYKLRGGQEIEIGYGSNLPPGAKGGQHVSMNYIWWRIPNGKWERAECRNTQKLIEIANISDNIEEFRQLQEIY